jgi:iron complex outermembrane recepter protein
MKCQNKATLRRNVLAQSLVVAMCLPFAVTAFAQNASADEDAKRKETTAETKEIESVTVVGSRIKRTETEGPAAVTVISSEQIEAEGFVTVFDALNTLTQATGNTQNELFQNGFTPNASVINLRGLGAGRTLLLINGRRAADYPLPYNGQSNFANYGNIPAAAVDRIEVLAGGASAIYGSDAVAGVVNVVLKKNYEGNDISLQLGSTTRGGRDTSDFQWVGGHSSDKFNITYAFESYYSEPLYAFQRDFMDSLLDNPFPNAITGQQPIGSVRLTRPVGSATNSFYNLGNICGQWDDFVPFNFRSGTTGANLGPACGTFVDVGYQAIANSNNDLSAYVYGNYDFNDKLKGWASLQVWNARASFGNGTQFWGGPGGINGGAGSWFSPVALSNASGVVTPANTPLAAQRVFTPQEAGGVDALLTKSEETSIDFAVGLNGTMFERFDWDLTIGHARYETETRRPRMVSALVNDFFGDFTGGATGGRPNYVLDLARYSRPLTPAEFASLNTSVVTDATSKVTQASFVVSGDLFELPAGSVGFAAVLEAASQSYDLNADPRILPDRREIYNLTGTGGGGERDRYAFGTEFKVPVVESLTASLAARFDKYEDVTAVDNAFTWNAGLEWRPTDSLLVRGTVSTSFKSPDMHFVFAERSGAFSAIFDTYRCLAAGFTATACGSGNPTYSYTAFGVRQGTTELEEENGKSKTIGFVYDIIDGMSVSFDYYDVSIEGGVSDITSAFILDAEAGCRTGLTRNRNPYEFAATSAFCVDILSRVDRGVPAGTETIGAITEIRRGPINRAFQGTNGIDASFKYRFDTDRFGSYSIDLGWSHTLSNVQAEFAGDPRVDLRDSLTNFDSRSRVRGTFGWQKGNLSANIFGNRLGSFPNWQETGRIHPFVTWNMNFGVKIREDIKATVFVNNVFDEISPEDDGFDAYPYFWRAFSPIGREFYAKLEFSF